MSSPLVAPYRKTTVISGTASARRAQAAGTTAAELVRRAYETSRRTPTRSPSAAAPLIRGSSAVTRETVMMPCGTDHSR